jgi:ATP-dependent helicase HrpB
MAAFLGESVGETVGYRMRLDTRVGPRTQIEVVTEGVLTRMLQSDPALEGVAAIVFDEFHERSLQADVGLALCLDARANLETTQRLIVMSATLDDVAVAGLLGTDTPIVRSEGRSFPVAIEYLGTGLPVLPGGPDAPERLVAAATRRALRETDGDVLVFLPGAAEIRRVQEMLETAPEVVEDGVSLRRLYGELDPREQELALAASPHGPRRVILATNIAETSVTLPGIRAVVDSGLVRRAVFDPVSGMSRPRDPKNIAGLGRAACRTCRASRGRSLLSSLERGRAAQLGSILSRRNFRRRFDAAGSRSRRMGDRNRGEPTLARRAAGRHDRRVRVIFYGASVH